MYILETAQLILTVADGFHWFVHGFGNMDQLSDFYLSNLDTPIMNSITGLIVQTTCCWRIYLLSKNKTWPSAIMMVVIFQVTSAFVVGAMNERVSQYSKIPVALWVIIPIWLAGSALADIMIAGSLTYLLFKSRSWVNRKSRGMLLRIAIIIIEANTVTAIAAVATLVTAILPSIRPPKSSIFMCPSMILGKLYSNSHFTMLNQRAFMPRYEETDILLSSVYIFPTDHDRSPVLSGVHFASGEPEQSLDLTDLPHP